jgi:hypothetical protein
MESWRQDPRRWEGKLKEIKKNVTKNIILLPSHNVFHLLSLGVVMLKMCRMRGVSCGERPGGKK